MLHREPPRPINAAARKRDQSLPSRIISSAPADTQSVAEKSPACKLSVLPKADTFAEWQPQYAAHGIATFPVELIDDDKKPMTKGWQRVGARGSEQLAIKFPHATMLGFVCGRRNRICIVDMDSTDESIL